MIWTIDLSTCNLIDARLAYLFRCSITVKVRLTTAINYYIDRGNQRLKITNEFFPSHFPLFSNFKLYLINKI